MAEKEIIRGDFHLHTSYSQDSSIGLEELIDRTVAKGINCLAVTDHDSIQGAVELERIAPFRVIIGQEVTSKDGHIIGLFLKKRVPRGLDTAATIREIKAQGGIAIAPHPFARICSGSLQAAFVRNYKLFDAVEVANSNNIIRRDDLRAAAFAKRNGLLAISGSDSHRIAGIGSNIVSMPNFETPLEFLSSLSRAKLDNSIHPTSYLIGEGLPRLGYTIRKRSKRAARRLSHYPRLIPSSFSDKVYPN